MYCRDTCHHFYCGYLYLSFHKIRKWLPRTTWAHKWEMTVIQLNGVAAGSLPLTYAASCKIASERTTREINDFLDKGSSKAESISPEAKRENGGREMERWRRRGEGIHHLVRRSISFAWFILSKAPTMQMTHKVEIERLWSRCQEWIYIWLPGGPGVLNHFQLDDTFNIEPLI